MRRTLPAYDFSEGTDVTRKTVRIAMNGVTGRMGYRQHLVRSILAIREQGGLDLGDGTVLWPEPILVGRREHVLRAMADAQFPPEAVKQLVPAARAGRPEEVAALVAFLCSDAAGYINGQVIGINGGMA